MRSSAFTILFALIPAIRLVVAQAVINESDVPASCKTICQPLVQLSGTCNAGGSSSASTDCICKNTSFNVIQVGSLCAICLTQTSSGTPGLSSISSACHFTATNYNAATASQIAATVTVTATKPGSNSIATLAPSATVSNVAVSSPSSASSSSSSKAAAAAPMRTMGMGFIGAAALVPLGMQAMQ